MHYVHKCFWLIKSTGWFGGATMVVPKRALRTPARFCAPQEADSHFDGNFGKAVQWSSGFNLGVALGVKGANLKAGFNGSAQTGYDGDAYMYFQFRDDKAGRGAADHWLILAARVIDKCETCVMGEFCCRGCRTCPFRMI